MVKIVNEYKKNTNWLGKKKQNQVLLGFSGASHVWIQKKKFRGRGGVKYEGYLSLAVRGGVPSHIVVISNVI